MMNQKIAEDLLYEEEFAGEENYLEVVEREYEGQSRWHTSYSKVYKHKPTDTFWKILWSTGSTEQQYNGLEDIDFKQVKPVTHTIVVYE